jgi:hypothetical protein
MKSHFILITAILATTAGFGVSGSTLASEPGAPVSQKLGEHPAVLVARAQANRGIDPNTFIVGHPAGRQVLAASPAAPSAKSASAGR